jgi:hypothetical protein
LPVDLRQVNGQDGVNITADLNYKVASYVYTSGGGSITIYKYIDYNGRRSYHCQQASPAAETSLQQGRAE